MPRKRRECSGDFKRGYQPTRHARLADQLDDVGYPEMQSEALVGALVRAMPIYVPLVAVCFA